MQVTKRQFLAGIHIILDRQNDFLLRMQSPNSTNQGTWMTAALEKTTPEAECHADRAELSSRVTAEAGPIPTALLRATASSRPSTSRPARTLNSQV